MVRSCQGEDVIHVVLERVDVTGNTSVFAEPDPEALLSVKDVRWIASDANLSWALDGLHCMENSLRWF